MKHTSKPARGNTNIEIKSTHVNLIIIWPNHYYVVSQSNILAAYTHFSHPAWKPRTTSWKSNRFRRTARCQRMGCFSCIMGRAYLLVWWDRVYQIQNSCGVNMISRIAKRQLWDIHIFIEYTLHNFHIFGVISDAFHITSTLISANICFSNVNHISKSNCVTNYANLTLKLI